MNLEEHWKPALDRVVEAIRMAVSLETEEALLGERQVVAALYSYFFEQGRAELAKGNKFALHTEAGFVRESRRKCDLRMRSNEIEYWMEVKFTFTKRLLKGKFLKAPRGKQLISWIKDADKLREIKNAETYLIIITITPNDLKKYYVPQFQLMDNKYDKSSRHEMVIDIEWRGVVFDCCEILVWNCSHARNEG